MKKIFVMMVMAMLCSTVMYAQSDAGSSVETQKQLAKERRANKKLTVKEITVKANKYARAEAKKWAKEGWKAAAGMLPIEKQIEEVQVRQNTYDGNFPKYFIGRGTGVSSTASMARKMAVSRARVDLAGSIKAEVAELTEETASNTEMSQQESQAIAKTVETSQTLIQQSLGRTDVILDIYRVVNGKTEEQVVVSYEGAAAKADVMKAFEKDSEEIKGKLKDMLDKE